MESYYLNTIPKENTVDFYKNFNQQTLLNVVYWGYDGKIHKGQIFCNLFIAHELKNIFHELFELKFPIFSVKPISAFHYSDQFSMESNNTTCFDFRAKTLQNGFSKHANGKAIDLNPLQNPFISFNQLIPINSSLTQQKGSIRMTDETGIKVIQIFRKYGWHWGGNWEKHQDYMHFEK